MQTTATGKINSLSWGLFFATTILFGCSEDSADKKVPALPDGTYSVSSPVCTDTNAAPAYTAAVQPAFIRDYVNADSPEIVVAGADATAVMKDSDCQLTNGQKVFFNSGSVVTFAQYSTNEWSPSGCKLTVSVNGEETDVDENLTLSDGSTKVYQDNSAMTQGGAFDVAVSGDAYTLTLGISLSDFGCNDGAKFRWTWTKKS